MVIKRVKVKATRRFHYGGRDLKPEDEFEAAERDAVILVGSKQARYADESYSPPRPRRRYRRRDMTAES